MKSLPYFKWYPADAEIDENYSALSDTELGFYHRCLNRSWMNNGLPSDLNRLASTMKVSRKYLDRIWPSVSKCFVFTDTVIPRYVNTRQEEERQSAIAKSRQSSEAVAVRELRRTGRSSTDVSTDASTDHPRAYESESVSVSVPKKEEKERAAFPVTNPRWKSDPQFAEFAGRYLETGGAFIDADFSKAYEFNWKRLDFEQKIERVSALARHAEEYRSDPRYVPHPLKFLETEWQRPVKPKARDTAPATKQERLAEMLRNA